MNKVICPVDFSEVSQQALSVAAHLAISLNVELIALHVVHYPVSQIEDQSLVLPDVIHDLKEEELRLASWIESLPVNKSALKYKKVLKVGFLTEELAAIGDADSLIVSGTSGMKGLTSILLGSITQGIFNHLSSTILVIPSTYKYSPFKKICFATDLMSPLKWDVEELLSLSKQWGAHVSFLSVLDNAKSVDVESVGDSFVHKYLKDINYAYTSFHLNQADSATQGIRKFIHENKSDLLVLTHKDRTFWSGLFEKSVSGEFLANPEIPVLIFHQEVEK